MLAGTIKMFILPEQMVLIDRAANSLGKNRSDFILEVACEHAMEVLLDRTFFKLYEEKSRQFNAMLEAPTEPNAGLARLMGVEAAPCRSWARRMGLETPGAHSSPRPACSIHADHQNRKATQ